LGVLGALLVLPALMLAMLVAQVTGVSVTTLIGGVFEALFAASSVQALWYVTRAAGLIAYLLLWLATAWGIAVSSKILDPVLQGAFTYDFHEFLSLLAIGFVVLHVVVLLADRYLPFSIAAILVPFVAPYRPLWVGIGVMGLYLTLLVTITFYMRKRIGMKAFRMIHLASFIAYVLAAIHGLMAGTDSPLLATQLMYASTTLSIVFLTTYWIALRRLDKRPLRLSS
jgi:predicted ferric reductase